jgi:hypothetical protein
MAEGPGTQQWYKELRPQIVITSGKQQEHTHQDHQTGCRAESGKANIRDFIKLRKMSQNILEGSAP